MSKFQHQTNEWSSLLAIQVYLRRQTCLSFACRWSKQRFSFVRPNINLVLLWQYIVLWHFSFQWYLPVSPMVSCILETIRRVSLLRHSRSKLLTERNYKPSWLFSITCSHSGFNALTSFRFSYYSSNVLYSFLNEFVVVSEQCHCCFGALLRYNLPDPSRVYYLMLHYRPGWRAQSSLSIDININSLGHVVRDHFS